MQPISTLASYLRQQSAINDTRRASERYGLQLSTGKYALDLADNPARLQIVDLRGIKAHRQSYLQTAQLAQVTTGVYNISLNHITKLATDSLERIRALRNATANQSSTNLAVTAEKDIFDLYSELGTFVNNTMTDLTISLNEKNGDEYLYAGARRPTAAPTPPAYTLPPVRDLSTLPYFLSPTVAEVPANTTVAPYPAPANGPGALGVDPLVTSASATLPTYDADFGQAAPAAPYPSQITQAWHTRKVTIDDAEQVTVGITSTNKAFQDMVNGLRAAHTAADQASNYTTAERDAYMDQAVSSLTTAVDGLRALMNQNSLADAALMTKAKTHTSTINLLKTRLDTLEGIDGTEVAASLSATNTQLEASYKVTANLLGMSLLNYLK
jgi:flagellin-like hook-associated protein FlgL